MWSQDVRPPFKNLLEMREKLRIQLLCENPKNFDMQNEANETYSHLVDIHSKKE